MNLELGLEQYHKINLLIVVINSNYSHFSDAKMNYGRFSYCGIDVIPMLNFFVDIFPIWNFGRFFSEIDLNFQVVQVIGNLDN